MICVKNLKANKVVVAVFFYDVKNDHFCSCPSSKGNILQKALTFFPLLDISIWRTVYLMLTTDSLGNAQAIEKAAMF